MHNVINVCRSNSAYWRSSFVVGARSCDGGGSGRGWPSDAIDQVVFILVVDSSLSSLSD